MTHKRLLAAIALLLVCTAVVAWVSREDPTRALVLTARPELRIGTNITVSQLEARAELLKHSPLLRDSGIMNDRVFTLSNRSSHFSFVTMAYNPSLPYYWLATQRGANWQPVGTGISFPPAIDLPIRPRSALTFAAVVPTGEVCRIKMRCDLPDAGSRFGSLVRSLLHLSRRQEGESRMIWVSSGPVQP